MLGFSHAMQLSRRNANFANISRVLSLLLFKNPGNFNLMYLAVKMFCFVFGFCAR